MIASLLSSVARKTPKRLAGWPVSFVRSLVEEEEKVCAFWRRIDSLKSM